MPRYMLDTNICIYIRQARPEKVLRRFRRLAPGDAAISVITYGELRYGADKSAASAANHARLAAVLEWIPALPLPPDAAGAYGEIRARLEREGRSIGNNDLWIAAHARAAGLTLVTNNEREFSRVPGLRVENWVK